MLDINDILMIIFILYFIYKCMNDDNKKYYGFKKVYKNWKKGKYDNITEFDKDGKLIWEPYKGFLYDAKELLDLEIRSEYASEIMDSSAIQIDEKIEIKKQYINNQKKRWDYGIRW